MKRVFVRSIGNNYPGEEPYVTAAVTVGERGKVGPSARFAADNGDESLRTAPLARLCFDIPRLCMYLHIIL